MTTSPEIAHSRQIGPTRINYHDQGQGKPVLLIHGSGPGVTAWANWRLVLPVLAERARVIAPDLAGFGYTHSDDPADTSVEGWVRQVIGLLDALEIEECSIIGNSFGGAIAVQTALRHRARVTKLVLMGSVSLSFPITPGLDKVWGYQPSREAMRELLMKIFAYDPALITEDLVEMRYQASIRDDVQQRFAALFPAPRQRWVNSLATTEERLASLDIPTLLIHGIQDQVIPVDVSRRAASVLPQAQLHEVDRCGHWVQIEHTAEFLRTVQEFLFA